MQQIDKFSPNGSLKPGRPNYWVWKWEAILNVLTTVEDPEDEIYYVAYQKQY